MDKRKLVKIIGGLGALVGFVASILGIITFFSPYQNIQDVIFIYKNPGYLKNQYAEDDGVVWQASFYNNIELKDPIASAGSIKGTRNGLKVDWGLKSPTRKVNSDYFSGIFTSTIRFNSGEYCFVIVVDDGAMLFIDGRETKNVWWGYTPGAIYRVPHKLSEGPHTIQFYYYEKFGEASFHLWWYPNPGIECVTVGHKGA